MKKSLLSQPRLSWSRVAEEVSEKIGRKYSGAYCREVATGFRNSSVVEPVLVALGLMSPRKDGPYRASLKISERVNRAMAKRVAA